MARPRRPRETFRPSLPRRWALPNAARMPQLDRPELGKPEEPLVDRFGFAWNIYGRFPEAVRYYLDVSFEYLGLNKHQTPTAQPLAMGDRGGGGTVPEMVFFGLLLEAGYRPTRRGFYDKAPYRFIFQAPLMGGRNFNQPGGTVADFVVFHGGRSIAVPVQSVYHGLASPFGSGGAKTVQDRFQHVRLASTGYIDAVRPVNAPERGFALERGPTMAHIRRELNIALERE